LIVAWFRLPVGLVGDGPSVRAQHEELGLHPGLQPVALCLGDGELVLQHVARRVLDRLAAQMKVGREPADFGLPRELDQARRIGDRKHVGIGRGQVEVGCEPGKRRAVALHLSDRLSGYELGPQDAEQVDKTDQEIADPPIRRAFGKILRHQCLSRWRINSRSVPGSSRCRPAVPRPLRRLRRSARRGPRVRGCGGATCRRRGRGSALRS